MFKIGYPLTLRGENEFLVYSAIRCLTSNQYLDYTVLSIDSIIYEAYDTTTPSTKRRSTTINTIEALIIKGIIEAQKIKGGIYKIKNKYSFDKYASIDIDKYLKIKGTGILEFYVMLVSTYDNAKHIGYQSNSYLCDITGFSKNTITSYMRQLESLKVIHVYRSVCQLQGTNTNVYGDYEDADKIDAFGMQRDNVTEIHPRNMSNWRRSVSARYNKYLATPNKFTSEEVSQLYDDVVVYNQQMDDLQKLQPGSDYTDKKKDLLALNKLD